MLPVSSTSVNSPLPLSTCPGASPSSPMGSWRATALSMNPAHQWMVRTPYCTLKVNADSQSSANLHPLGVSWCFYSTYVSNLLPNALNVRLLLACNEWYSSVKFLCPLHCHERGLGKHFKRVMHWPNSTMFGIREITVVSWCPHNGPRVVRPVAKPDVMCCCLPSRCVLHFGGYASILFLLVSITSGVILRMWVSEK